MDRIQTRRTLATRADKDKVEWDKVVANQAKEIKADKAMVKVHKEEKIKTLLLLVDLNVRPAVLKAMRTRTLMKVEQDLKEAEKPVHLVKADKVEWEARVDKKVATHSCY